MKAISTILIACDGSPCSDAALRDLRRAGLPDAARAVLLTVADVIIPPSDAELPDAPAVRVPEVEQRAREHAEKAVGHARSVAARAADRVRADFPGWELTTEVDCDTPAWAVIKTADRLRADLIVVGSHAHSVAGGRLILGSVSQRVLYEARCSVRVARCSEERRGGPVRLVVGYDGSREADAAVAAVAARAWPAGSEARLLTAHDAGTGAQAGAAERLRAAGLTTSEAGRGEEPAHALIREAEEWDADSIFVGTRGLHGFQHLLHGSVSSAVAAGAQCSVEVVRAIESAPHAKG